jgi:hypothetical protein
MRRLIDYQVLKQDDAGVSDNCVWELRKVIDSEKKILSLVDLCPSGVTFL